MATITGFTAERMLAIENASIVDGAVLLDNLILTRRDGTTIDAGSVRGDTGLPGVSEATFTTGMADNAAAIASAQAALNALLADLFPIGSMVDYIDVAAPLNWLTMAGQTVVNGQTLYPIFWSKLPAAMKSGSSILMPNTKGRISAGYDVSDTDFNLIGKLGGEKTHVLTIAEMPVHDHPMNFIYAAAPGSGNALPIMQNTPGGQIISGPTGGGAAHNNLQPYITFLKIIKVA